MASTQEISYNHANHDTEIYVAFAVFTALSTFAIALRLLAKRLRDNPYALEDVLAFAAWVVALAQGILIVAAVQFAGAGRHISTLSKQKVTHFMQAYYAVSILQVTTLGLSKLSVVMQLHRIFATPRFQLVFKVLGLIVLSWWLAAFLAYIFVCTPIHAFWDPGTPSHCANEKALNLAIPIPWVLTDFAILLAPLPMISSLQLSTTKKIGLWAIFLTGSATCIIACVRYSKFVAFPAAKDITFIGGDIATWNIVEADVTTICACILVIRPALKYLFPEALMSSAKSKWAKFRTGNSDELKSMKAGSIPSTQHQYRYGPSLETHVEARAPRESGALPIELVKVERQIDSYEEVLQP